MTEIIINDVDISECKFFVKEQLEDFDVYIKNACGINGTECCLVPECYYKQLKRLETENAKLKEKYQEELTVNTQLRKWQDEDLRQIKELKIENDHLIADIKEKEKYLYEQEYLDKGMEKLRQENAKLKEALEEIKKISKVAFTVCDDDCGNANKFMDIINKVNEVLKDE